MELITECLTCTSVLSQRDGAISWWPHLIRRWKDCLMDYCTAHPHRCLCTKACTCSLTCCIKPANAPAHATSGDPLRTIFSNNNVLDKVKLKVAITKYTILVLIGLTFYFYQEYKINNKFIYIQTQLDCDGRMWQKYAAVNYWLRSVLASVYVKHVKTRGFIRFCTLTCLML